MSEWRDQVDRGSGVNAWWEAFKAQHLTPNAAIIFDADPIIVATDEEAARIAETVPNSHIKVVIRGVVVSEYYGQSTTNKPEGK